VKTTDFKILYQTTYITPHVHLLIKENYIQQLEINTTSESTRYTNEMQDTHNKEIQDFQRTIVLPVYH
jgi:hypothetical protein